MIETRSTFDYLRMRELRRKRGLESKDLAKKAGCSPNHLSRIENGKLPPGGPLAEKIAKVLRVPPESLYLPPGSAISPTLTSGLTPDEKQLLEAYRRLTLGYADFVRALTLNLKSDSQEEALDEAIVWAKGYRTVRDAERKDVKSATRPSKRATG